MDSSIPKNSEDQTSSSNRTESVSTENKPKIRLSLKKPSSTEKLNSIEVEDTAETNNLISPKETEPSKPKMSLRRKTVVDKKKKQGQPNEPIATKPLPDHEKIKGKLSVHEIKTPTLSSSLKGISDAPLVPNVAEALPVSQNFKTQKIQKDKNALVGVEKPKLTLNDGTLYKVIRAFIFVSILFIGAIYIFSKVSTSNTTNIENGEIKQAVNPSIQNPSLNKTLDTINETQNTYTESDSTFSEFYADPNSPFLEPSETPNDIGSSTEYVSTPEGRDSSLPIHKPTPNLAVVDFLNNLIIQGVKSKGDRHAALLDGDVYNVNSTVSDDLEIKLIEVDGEARHLIFKDKNGVRYRKPY